jgi:uncharacterized protein YbcI
MLKSSNVSFACLHAKGNLFRLAFTRQRFPFVLHEGPQTTLRIWRQTLTSMENSQSSMTQRVAQAASAFHQQQTGHTPGAVTVVLSKETLVITLHEALSEAEKALARNPAGAAQVQEFHRQLFTASSKSLRQQIRNIIGVDVREAAAEVEPSSGAVIQAFTTGTMVQVFLLAKCLTAVAVHASADGGRS